MGIHLIIYLDDILLMHQSKGDLAQLVSLVGQIFQALDLMVNLKKSQLAPTQEMKFLGFQVNSTSLHLALTAEKLRKVQQNARTLIHQQLVSVGDLARFVGKVTAIVRAIWQAPLHYRALQTVDQPLITRASKFRT